MHGELGSIKETVDLSSREVLDSAYALLTRHGYSIVQRTDTSLDANRREREGMFGHSLWSLTVIALPQPQGGVQIKLRGDDREGVQKRQPEWTEWANSLPKKKIESDAESETAQRPEEIGSETEPSITSEEQRAWAPAAPWERKLKATAAKAEQEVDLSIGAEAEETPTHVPGIEEPEVSNDEKTISKVVEAESFRLVNNRGELRALLTAHDDSPHLAFMDQEEEVRLMLNTNSEGNPTVAMTDDKGNIRVRLAVGHDGSPILDLIDNNEELRFRLTLEEGELPALTFVDEQGTPRAALKEDADGRYLLGFLDDREATRATFHLDHDGSPSLVFRNSEGEINFMLRVDSEGSNTLAMFDKDTELRTILQVGSDGAPSLGLTDDRGNLRAILKAGAANDDASLILLDRKGDLIWKAP